MKKLLFLISCILVSAVAHLQSDGLSYQAVIIDKNPQEIPGADISGNYLSDTEITLRFTITNSNQEIEFKESQVTTTDEFGMVNVIIGQGFTESDSQGEFDEINWNGTAKWLTVELAYNGSEFDELSHQNLLFVPYAYHRNIIATQTLDVDGASTLNSTLNVADATQLGSTLEVQDETTLSDNLYVGGQTTLDQTLTVNGISVMNQSLSVLNQSAAYLSGTLQVDDAATLGNSLQVDGTADFNNQVTIDSFEEGGESSYGAYPLRVEGSSQGIAIKVNPNEPGSANNFVSFFNGGGGIVGRIEGQTVAEFESSPEHLFQLATFAAESVTAGVNLGTAIAGVNVCPGLPIIVCPPSWSDIAMATANAALVVIKTGLYIDHAYSNLGVTYGSGSADYAEYLEKINPNELISAGDVVGIVGGKITLDLSDASQILVVSTNPAVLGNMPLEGESTAVEKVAFMGQVPIKVYGEVSIGDYLIPSGNNDGIAVGISKERIDVDQYNDIIGIAWSASNPEQVISRVNVSIGLNSNDLASVVSSQQKELDAMRSEIETIKALLKGEQQPTASAMTAEEELVLMDLVRKEQDIRAGVYNTYEAPESVTPEFVSECMNELKALLLEQGRSMSEFPGLEKFYIDAEFRNYVIHETIQMYEYGYKYVNR
ncbi:MAG: hypothetical protein AB8B53_15235 [Flavobacteriales bacterium]